MCCSEREREKERRKSFFMSTGTNERKKGERGEAGMGEMRFFSFFSLYSVAKRSFSLALLNVFLKFFLRMLQRVPD